MTQRPPIDRRLALLAGLTQMPVDGDMRRHRTASQFLDKVGDVVSLIGTQRDPTRAIATMAVDQFQRLIPLGRAGRLAHATQHR